jgi:hypothetical protein
MNAIPLSCEHELQKHVRHSERQLPFLETNYGRSGCRLKQKMKLGYGFVFSCVNEN